MSYYNSFAGHLSGAGASNYSTLSTSFNGTDQDCRFPDAAFSAFATSSLSFWIRTDLVAANQCIFIASNTAGTSDLIALSVLNTGSIAIQGRSGGVNRFVGTTAAGTITADTYCHLLWTKTGSTHHIYVDGVDKTITFTVSTNLSLWFSSYGSVISYTVGQLRRNTNANYFAGYMDEISIFSDVKSYSDFHTGGKPKDLTGLTNMAAWCRMGEGSTYPTINDESGNSNTLTMTNMSSANFVSVVP